MDRLVARAMAVGSLAFAALGLAAPQAMGSAAGLAPRTARLLGARDVVVGVALLARPGPVTLVARGLSDLGDAVLVGRKRPAVAAFAATAGVVSLGAASAHLALRG